MESDRLLIDNSRTVYHRIRLRCGVLVECQPTVLGTCPILLDHLNNDLDQCLRILPPSVHALVRRTCIWINLTYAYGNQSHPNLVNHITTHHHEAWLLWARDRPDKAHGIEIYNVTDYIRMRQYWNGCGLILHELCHLIHQHVLGLDHAPIQLLYDRAVQSGMYECVLRRDWVAQRKNDNATDLAYAMVNPKEFFAEMSVTYWATGYTDLDQCGSPPPPIPCYNHDDIHPSSKETWIMSQWLKMRTRFQTTKVPCRPLHCNKFFPFTRGQLKFHDVTLERDVHGLWQQIAEWNDLDEYKCGRDDCTFLCGWIRLSRFSCNWNSPFGHTFTANSVRQVKVDDTIDL